MRSRSGPNCFWLVLVAAAVSAHEPPPLLPQPAVAALAQELSGETAKRTVASLAGFHRQRGSRGFHAAATLIADRAREYGLSDVQILRFPADGHTFYGTQKARQAWDADEAELTEVRDGGEVTLASYAAQPIVLAEDSESAEVNTDLVDVGDGTHDGDYDGKEATGKIVLVREQPGDVQLLAIGKYKAVGILSAAQNQKTAWWGEDENLIRWGHLESFSVHPAFAFMVSLKTARALQARLRGGERIRLHAHVKAGQHAGFYEVVTAIIEGSDPRLKEQEIAFSCHLDHQLPGANDNASGCAAILEAARALQRLIATGKLSRPARTLRFIWPPEVEGTVTLLNANPQFQRRIRAVVHMDMVGGGVATKAVFHVTRGPLSLPSFVHDVAWAFAAWVNGESYAFAAGTPADQPLIAPEGGEEPLRAVYSPYTMGSDHDVYQDSSFGIPAIYLNDWPDRYIHTNFDTPANIDPTKLRRAAFIGAASGYFLANYSARDFAAASEAVVRGRLLRHLAFLDRHAAPEVEAEYERGVSASLGTFGIEPMPRARHGALRRPIPTHPADELRRFRRAAEPRGPLMVFGYDYFAEHARAAGIPTPALLGYHGEWGSGEEYAYEALNLADGTRTVRQITAELTAEYGPVPQAQVLEYLQALSRIGVLD